MCGVVLDLEPGEKIFEAIEKQAAPKTGQADAPASVPAAVSQKEDEVHATEVKAVEEPKSNSSADDKNSDTSKGDVNPIVASCEELIAQYPFSMRLINTKIGKFFTDDKLTACANMSKAELLSNGLWVETDIIEAKTQMFVRGLKKYCEKSVNM